MASFPTLLHGFWARSFINLSHFTNLDSNPGRKEMRKVKDEVYPECSWIINKDCLRNNHTFIIYLEWSMIMFTCTDKWRLKVKTCIFIIENSVLFFNFSTCPWNASLLLSSRSFNCWWLYSLLWLSLLTHSSGDQDSALSNLKDQQCCCWEILL